MKLVLCVGHSRQGDNGAISARNEITEYEYWRGFAHWFKQATPGHQVSVIDSYDGANYTRAMNHVASRVRTQGADLAIELHFNAFNGVAHGSEVLYWHASLKGQEYAKSLQASHAECHLWQNPRGAKPIYSTGRGAQFLRKTHCPALIWEPFFGDAEREWTRFRGTDGYASLAASLHTFLLAQTGTAGERAVQVDSLALELCNAFRLANGLASESSFRSPAQAELWGEVAEKAREQLGAGPENCNLEPHTDFLRP